MNHNEIFIEIEGLKDLIQTNPSYIQYITDHVNEGHSLKVIRNRQDKDVLREIGDKQHLTNFLNQIEKGIIT